VGDMTLSTCVSIARVVVECMRHRVVESLAMASGAVSK